MQNQRKTKRNPNTAFFLELIPGIFCLLGIGYIYAGKTKSGILRLIIWFLYQLSVGVFLYLVSFMMFGLLCIPFQFIILITVPVLDAIKLKKDILNEGFIEKQ
jgi:hypothetical protein